MGRHAAALTVKPSWRKAPQIRLGLFLGLIQGLENHLRQMKFTRRKCFFEVVLLFVFFPGIFFCTLVIKSKATSPFSVQRSRSPRRLLAVAQPDHKGSPKRVFFRSFSTVQYLKICGGPRVPKATSEVVSRPMVRESCRLILSRHFYSI